MNIGFAGEARFVVKNSDGSVKFDTGYQKNLILNQGLEFFGGGKGGEFNASCVIGSGNSSPVVTQSKLDAFIAITSYTSITSSYDYVDKGDNLYQMWEQKLYRFTGLDNVNISECGLVSTGGAADYYLTTRVLIKDNLGAPTSITVLSGETLDVYYKTYKVISILDKNHVVNMLNGSGGSVPYNVTVRPARIGMNDWKVSVPISTSAYVAASTKELQPTTSFPAEETRSSSWGLSPYQALSNKIGAQVAFGLNDGNLGGLRSLAVIGGACRLLQCQIRFGRVSDDTSIPKTANDTLTIPLEFSWGRYEGVL